MIIARRGGGDQSVALGKDLSAGIEHFLGRNDRDHLRAGRICDLDRPAHHDHLMARPNGCLGQRRPIRPLEALVK